jgi:hypothetical protein
MDVELVEEEKFEVIKEEAAEQFGTMSSNKLLRMMTVRINIEKIIRRLQRKIRARLHKR